MSFFSLQILRLKKLWIIFQKPMLRRAFFKHLVMAGVEHQAVLNRPLATVGEIVAYQENRCSLRRIDRAAII